jgi:ribosome maturation factor RimP
MTDTQKPKPETLKATIESKIAEWIAPLGYEIVAAEFAASGHRTLRLFIDHLGGESKDGAKIGIGDCITVTKALNEPLDALKEIEELYGSSGYELEVSSPGIDRPLKKPRDFQKFSGQLARIHVFRPLSASELKNADYQLKNPKQKNFVGTLLNLEGTDVVLNVQTGSKKEIEPSRVCIPLGLISKANLEPVFDFSEERKSKA